MSDAGDVRIRRKFLWFPMSIDGDIRWLSKQIWWEERQQRMGFSMTKYYKWVPIAWTYKKSK